LAAPQVGVLERILVTAIPVRRGLSQEEDGDDEAGSRAYLTELINPEIIEKDGEVRFDEGCLSVPELTIPVDRYQRVVIRALDRQGEPFQFEAHDFYAVVFQHEMDHLDGKTLVDRLSKLKRAIYLKKLKKKRRDDLESSDDAAPPPD
jgi:peptide deformylase